MRSRQSADLHLIRSPGAAPAADKNIRRRILVLAPRDPHPAIGGDRVRMFKIARELARHYDLTLLTFCRNPRERNAPRPEGSVFKRVHRIVLPRWRRFANALAALPTAAPLQIAYYRSEEFRQAVRHLAREHDAVLAHLVRTADYALDASCLRILEMTDAISLNMMRVAQTPAAHFDPRRLLYAIERNRLRAYEHSAAGEFDIVTLTSSVDAEFLFPGRLPHNTLIVANGVEMPESAPPIGARVPGEIALVGNFASLQNLDAASFFTRDVLPKVLARLPAARLRLIGPMPKLAKRRFERMPGVVVEGVVPSIPDALATARVGVCPTRIGAGVQNKLLDYFANRVPAVSTFVGLEGLEALPDEHALVASSPETWADHVIRLLTDDVLAQRLADASRSLVQRRYRWDRRVQPLVDRIERHFALDRLGADNGASTAAVEAAI